MSYSHWGRQSRGDLALAYEKEFGGAIDTAIPLECSKILSSIGLDAGVACMYYPPEGNGRLLPYLDLIMELEKAGWTPYSVYHKDKSKPYSSYMLLGLNTTNPALAMDMAARYFNHQAALVKRAEDQAKSASAKGNADG